MIKLRIRNINYSQTQNGAYALILEDETSKKKLPIIIGGFEAQSIAIAMENDIKPPRPLTHDLLYSLCLQVNVKIDYIHIHKLLDGVFYSSIVGSDGAGNAVELDSRTSDAVAIAVRFKCPIYTSEDILVKAGILMDNLEDELDELSNQISEADEPLDMDEDDIEIDIELDKLLNSAIDVEIMSIAELEEKLEQSVENENYEEAAKYRDELDKRKGQ